MNNSIPAVSVRIGPPANMAAECKKPSVYGTPPNVQPTASLSACQSGKLHSQFAGYMAFGAAALVAMIAAATVASHDVPLMLGGF